ncbi:MAG TPA: hypothetical protein VMV49_13945 [Candidatus Deferrimicrobium sp.]|nr:hypothetical protein [Candidatus Deferrimicrobium sp.]
MEVSLIPKYGKKIGIISLLAGIICIVVGLTLIQGENSVIVSGMFGTAFTVWGFAVLLTTFLASRQSNQ